MLLLTSLGSKVLRSKMASKALESLCNYKRDFFLGGGLKEKNELEAVGGETVTKY